MHVIAAKAVAFGEALRPDFKDYIKRVISNAQALSDQLIKGGLDTVYARYRHSRCISRFASKEREG